MKPDHRYHAVIERDGKLYADDICIGRIEHGRIRTPDLFGYGGREIADRLGMPPVYGDLHAYRCPDCAAYFLHLGSALFLPRCADCQEIIDATIGAERRARSAELRRERVARWVEKRSEARRAARKAREPVACAVCGSPIEAVRSTRKTCSDRCRQALHRSGAL
jgi:hypothetical protein